MKKTIKIIATVILSLFFLASLIDVHEFAIITAISAAGIYFIWKKPKEKKKKKKGAEEPKKPNRHEERYKFYIAGTHFEQCNGMTGQEVLASFPKREMKEHGHKLYGGYTKKEMDEDDIDRVDIYEDEIFFAEVEETTYEGEYSVKVFYKNELDKYQIGWIKKSNLNKFKSIYPNMNSMWLEISGGKTKDIDGDIEESDYIACLNINVVTYDEAV